jgi:hypothetical protein
MSEYIPRGMKKSSSKKICARTSYRPRGMKTCRWENKEQSRDPYMDTPEPTPEAIKNLLGMQCILNVKSIQNGTFQQRYTNVRAEWDEAGMKWDEGLTGPASRSRVINESLETMGII